MARPTTDTIAGLLEGYVQELENARRRADAPGKVSIEECLDEVRSVLDGLEGAATGDGDHPAEPLPEIATAGQLASLVGRPA